MIYVEVSTLFDWSWSGIANVTANLCRVLVDQGRQVGFFAFDRLVSASFVQNALTINDGAGLGLLFEQGFADGGSILARPEPRDNEVAIYPNFKRSHQHFARELLIVHDLSFDLTPEFHRPNYAAEYARRIYRDAHEVDHICCVSEATRRDLIRYYRVPAEKVFVAHNGVEFGIEATSDISASLLKDLELSSGEYFLVLGTIEPRKNIGLLLGHLRSKLNVPNLNVLNKYKFVFVGRDGWGKTFHQLCVENGTVDPRIIHLGYLSDVFRKELLRNCAALIYPSMFEGFGMPVIEGMAAGVPVLVSRSSSLVELGVDEDMSFDPCSQESFAEVFERFLQLSPDGRKRIGINNRARARQFTWSGFAQKLLARTGHGMDLSRAPDETDPKLGENKPAASRPDDSVSKGLGAPLISTANDAMWSQASMVEPERPQAGRSRPKRRKKATAANGLPATG